MSTLSSVSIPTRRSGYAACFLPAAGFALLVLASSTARVALGDTANDTKSVNAQCGSWLLTYNITPFTSWGSAPDTIKNNWTALDCSHRLCAWMATTYSVTPGQSWGTLPAPYQAIWSGRSNCDAWSKTYSGAADPCACLPSYVYKGTTYEGCTEADSQGEPWCAVLSPNSTPAGCTSADGEDASLVPSADWKYCQWNDYLPDGLLANDQCGAWLLKYNITPNTSSIPDSIKTAWTKLDCAHRLCAWMVENYKVVPEKAWGNLPAAYQALWDSQDNCSAWSAAYLGTTDACDCLPSYKYRGSTYKGCTEADSRGKPWCAVLQPTGLPQLQPPGCSTAEPADNDISPSPSWKYCTGPAQSGGSTGGSTSNLAVRLGAGIGTAVGLLLLLLAGVLIIAWRKKAWRSHSSKTLRRELPGSYSPNPKGDQEYQHTEQHQHGMPELAVHAVQHVRPAWQDMVLEPAGSQSPQEGTSVAGVCIHVAEEISGLARKVAANHARCTRLAQCVECAAMLLRAICKDFQRHAGWLAMQEQLEPQLVAIRDVFLSCKQCVMQWTKVSATNTKAITAMFCSKEHDDQFVKLHAALADAMHGLAMQPLTDASSSLKSSTLESQASSSASTTVGGRYHMLCSAFAASYSADLGSADRRTDLLWFASWMARGNGWKSLSQQEQDHVSSFYNASSMDFLQLVEQVQSSARSHQLAAHVNALAFIRFEDICGDMGKDKQLEYICMGGFGTVYRGWWQGEEVAVKKLEASEARAAFEELSREAYIMSTCRHPNIAQVYGMAREPSSGVPMIIMKYYERGSLRDVLDEFEPAALSTPVRYRMAIDVARGMAYLHGRPHEMIVHGDLKPSNLLVDKDMRVYISDFGLASMATATRTIASKSTAQSVVYSAPELLEGLRFTGLTMPCSRRTAAGDVYSFGMVLYELFTGAVPFAGANEGQVLACVVNRMRPFIPPEAGSSHAATAGVPAALAHIIERCWAHDPGDRPSFSQVVISLEATALALHVQVPAD